MTDTQTLLRILRQHATSDGEVNLTTLQATGFRLDLLGDTLAGMRDVKVEYDAGPDRPIDRITLRGSAKQGLPNPPFHPAD